MSESKEVVKKMEHRPEKTRQIPTLIPRVDIYENDEEILLYADMPGVAREDITVHLDNGKLSLTGVRRMEHGGAPRLEEFGAVEYRRVFSVPQGIDIDKVNAELKDGVLCLHLPKSEAVRPKQIEIKAA